jgi:hypothetical protein
LPSVAASFAGERERSGRTPHDPATLGVPVDLKEAKVVDDREAAVAEVLHDAAETHHIVFKIVDGEDPDWASWYADWLIQHSLLPKLLGTAPVRSELVHLLVLCDKQFASGSLQGRWEDHYARALIAELGARR